MIIDVVLHSETAVENFGSPKRSKRLRNQLLCRLWFSGFFQKVTLLRALIFELLLVFPGLEELVKLRDFVWMIVGEIMRLAHVIFKIKQLPGTIGLLADDFPIAFAQRSIVTILKKERLVRRPTICGEQG